MIEDTVALSALIAAATALAFWLDRRVEWASKVGATLLVIIFGALLSNLGLVATASPVYDFVTGPVTSLAIVWLLFAVDLRDLRAAGPRMLAAFGIAVAATATGALAATFTFGAAFGDAAWRLAGVMTGTYAGGSLNFVAVGRELELSDELFAAAAAADNVMTAVWIGATLMLPLWLGRFYAPVPEPPEAPGAAAGAGASTAAVAAGGAREAGAPPAAGAGTAEAAVAGLAGGAGEGAVDGVATAEDVRDDGGDAVAARARDPSPGDSATAPDDEPEHPFFGAATLRLLDIAGLLALGLGLLLAADLMGRWVPAVPSVLWLTTFALAVGQLPAVRRLAGAMQLGTLALHFFFVVIGIGSRVAEIARVGPEVFYFTAMVVLIHGTLTYGGAWLARLDVGTTSVASQAAVGGPSTALALAVARDWRALVLPGIVAGLLGYAAGNYVGFGIAYLVRGVLGG